MCVSPFLTRDKHGILKKVQCGMCIECVKRKAAEWTGRLIAESTFYPYSAFITLTYSDEYLPSDGVSTSVITKFAKDVRNRGVDLRYFAVGEYGGQFGRPHYHILAYGVNIFKTSLFSHLVPNFDGSFRCECPIWNKGFVNVEEAASGNISYIAGYVKSKLDLQQVKLREAGRNPSFNQMSVRPAIGLNWMLHNRDKMLSDGCIKLGGCRYPIPRYFWDKVATLPEKREYKLRNSYDFAVLENEDYDHFSSVSDFKERQRSVYNLQSDRLSVREAGGLFMERSKK